MNWSVYINQKAIVQLNEELTDKLDLKDAVILDWMMNFHAEPNVKKLMIDDVVYFWAAYKHILNENPLLKIRDKNILSDRMNKLVKSGLLLSYTDKNKGNLTYFSITQKCFDLIKRDKNTLTVQKPQGIVSKTVSLTVEKPYNNLINNNISTPIHKENADISISKKIKGNDILSDAMRMKYKNMDLDAKADEFELFCLSIQKKHNNDTDMFNHFHAWLRQNQYDKTKDITPQVEKFLKIFNTVAKTDYKPTDEIIDLLRKQLNKGFNEDDIIKAVMNLRSSSDKNDWHKKTNFQFATPVHLLKDDNLNKYLNVKL